MRPITTFTMCAYLAVVATPAVTASADYFLKLGDVKGESAKSSGGHKGEIEILSWSWGASNATHTSGGGLGAGKVNVQDISITRAATSTGGVSVAAGDVDGDGRADVTTPRDAASGMPTGKRQHGWITVIKPLDRGAVRVKVRFPWTGCSVGARYPEITLGDPARSYRLQDVTVSECAADSVSLNYAKITVRGWDPEKKEL